MDAGTPRSRWRWLWFTWGLCCKASWWFDDFSWTPTKMNQTKSCSSTQITFSLWATTWWISPPDSGQSIWLYLCYWLWTTVRGGGNVFVIHLTEWTCDMRRDWKSSCRYFKTLIPGTTWPRPRSSSSSSLTNISYHFIIAAFLLLLRRRTIRVSQGLNQPH